MNETDRDPHTIYEVRLRGKIAARWVEWFDGLAMTYTDDGDTLLRGAVADQAALHGLLIKVRDLGLTLLAVQRVP